MTKQPEKHINVVRFPSLGGGGRAGIKPEPAVSVSLVILLEGLVFES